MDDVQEEGRLYRGEPGLLPLRVTALPTGVIWISEGPLDFPLKLQEPFRLGEKLVSEVTGIPELSTILEAAVAELCKLAQST